MSLVTSNFECLFRTGSCPPINSLKFYKNNKLFSKNDPYSRHLNSTMLLSQKLKNATFISNSSTLTYVQSKPIKSFPKNVF